MTATVEGWPVLTPGHRLLHTWTIPGANRRITLRNGSAGLILAHVALSFHEQIERLDAPAERKAGADDGGHAYRQITGGTSWSKHATGAAVDLNWRQHPYGVAPGVTFSDAEIARIRRWLRRRYALAGGDVPVVEWGGDWPSHPGSTARPDGMHFQIHSAVRMGACETLARRLMDTKRGRRILACNKGQRRVVLS